MAPSEIDGFFEGAARDRAPGAKLKEVNDGVVGTVSDQYIVDYHEFGKDKPKIDERTGQPVKQLVIVLDTEHKGWQNVSKVPTDDEGKQLDPSIDNGKRAIFVRPGTNIYAAVGKAVKDATGKTSVVNGGKLGVKVVEHRDTGKGNPLKVHAAMYQAPSAESQFFGGASSTPAPAQAPAQQPSKPAADPWAAPAPSTAPVAAQGAASGDPWGSPEPPF